MKTSKQYWKERALEHESLVHQFSLEAYAEIAQAFTQAQQTISTQISSWITRVAENNQITPAQAQALLSKNQLEEFHWTVEEYMKYGKANALSGLWMKQLENASAKFHLTQLEALKINTQQALERAFGNQLDLTDKLARKSYTESYYRSLFSLQQGGGIGWDLGAINETELDDIVSKPWAVDGRNFSSRIWTDKTKMVNQLHNTLSRAVALGKNPETLWKEMEAFLDKEIANGQYCAQRILRTEAAYFSSRATAESYEELGVEWYQILATLDSKTSEICREMDGKVFPLSEYRPGATANPFHPFCRTTTIPHNPDSLFDSGSRIARDEEGEQYYVPGDMTYQEWKKTFVDGGSKEGLLQTDYRGTMEWKRTTGKAKLDSAQVAEIEKLKEDLGIKGELNLAPQPLDVSQFTFDDVHINTERGRNISREEAVSFMENATYSVSRWKGESLNFYSPIGAAYLNTTDNTIRTAFKRENFDPKAEALMNAVLALLALVEEESEDA